MATIIDSLVVELGLDPKKFSSGEKEAEASLGKLDQAASKTGKNIEKGADNMAASFSKLRNQALGFGAALLGASGIKDFIQNTVRSSNEIGRFSQITGTSVKTLSAWRNVAEQTGGTAEGITGTIRGITNQLQQFSLTGESSAIPYFRALEISVTDSNNQFKSATQLLLEMADAKKRLNLSDARFASIATALGVDDATITLLLRGRGAMEGLIAAQEKVGLVSKEDIAAADALTKSWNETSAAATSLGRSVLTFLTPALTGALGVMSALIKKANEPQSTSTYVAAAGEVGVFSGLQGTDSVPGSSSQSSSSPGAFKSQAEKEAFIRAEAVKRGIDPDVAMGVARSEGFDKFSGDQNTSFGAFQLHYKNSIPGLSNSGLGDTFTKQTGLDARDPKNEAETIKFALDQAKAGGWSPWHGWRGSPRAGLPGGAQAAGNFTTDNSRTTGSTSSSETHIGQIVINTPSDNAEGIAKDIAPALRQQSAAAQSNYGLQ